MLSYSKMKWVAINRVYAHWPVCSMVILPAHSFLWSSSSPGSSHKNILMCQVMLSLLYSSLQYDLLSSDWWIMSNKKKWAITTEKRIFSHYQLVWGVLPMVVLLGYINSSMQIGPRWLYLTICRVGCGIPWYSTSVQLVSGLTFSSGARGKG